MTHKLHIEANVHIQYRYENKEEIDKHDDISTRLEHSPRISLRHLAQEFELCECEYFMEVHVLKEGPFLALLCSQWVLFVIYWHVALSFALKCVERVDASSLCHFTLLAK